MMMEERKATNRRNKKKFSKAFLMIVVVNFFATMVGNNTLLLKDYGYVVITSLESGRSLVISREKEINELKQYTKQSIFLLSVKENNYDYIISFYEDSRSQNEKAVLCYDSQNSTFEIRNVSIFSEFFVQKTYDKFNNLLQMYCDKVNG